MRIYESGENYMEVIYTLLEEKQEVRSIDIARYLGYSKPSVSRAIGVLKAEDLIIVDESGRITFTEQGKQKAHEITQRHKVITEFLVSLGVNKEIADKDACKIEHIISEETLMAIKNFKP